MVAREGNITKAARKLNVTQPSLSELISDLEYNLKVQLFERLPRGVRLTPQGERLYLYAKKVVEEHEAFEESFYEKEDNIRGELKIITYPFVGAEWLIPSLNKFIRNYPAVDIKIRLEPENINPAEADITLATYIPHQPHLIQKPLFSARTHLFASKDYLKKYGIPQIPEDLNNHRLITYRGNYYSTDRSINLILHTGLKANEPLRKSKLEIDSLNGMMNAALQGYGIVELPNYQVVLNSGLEIVLPNIYGEDIMLYYIFLANRKNSKKLNKVYEYFLKSGIKL
jgi:DNA-binding transcriptional LysR family regulator